MSLPRHCHVVRLSHPSDNKQKALMELCVDHMAVLVNKAELASFQYRPDTETAATPEPPALSPLATQRHSNNSAKEKWPRARHQRESLTDPPEKPNTKSAPKRGLGLSINPDVGKCRGDESGGGVGGGGFDGSMAAAGVSGDDRRHGRDQPALFRQERSFDSTGAISALSGMSGLGVGGAADTRGGIEAFLLPEEEQVSKRRPQERPICAFWGCRGTFLGIDMINPRTVRTIIFSRFL